MFLSIIVPVYNVENYLKRCIQSIIDCNLSDYELILVNDGSTDRSREICEEYAKQYKDVILINKENGGLSDARNCGMNRAIGKYISFIDSDDYIISENFSKTIKRLKKIDEDNNSLDILVNDFFRVSDEEKIIDRINQIENTQDIINDEKYMNRFLCDYGCFWNTWRFVFRREFLIENSYSFKKGYLCEDIDFAVKALVSTNKIGFYHNPYYCYRIGRKSSIMNVVTIKRIDDYLSITSECMDLLNDNKPFFMKRMIDKLSIEYILNLATIYEVRKQDRLMAIDLFKKNLSILQYSDDSKCIFVNRSIKLLGVSAIAFMLFILKMVRRILKNAKSNFK